VTLPIRFPHVIPSFPLASLSRALHILRKAMASRWLEAWTRPSWAGYLA